MVFNQVGNFLIISWEGVVVQASLVDDEVSEVSVVLDEVLVMIYFLTGIKSELFFFWVELNAEYWILRRFHGGNESFALVVV